MEAQYERHIVVDLETLGTATNALILSIGAAEVIVNRGGEASKPEIGMSFYEVIMYEGIENAKTADKFSIDVSTVMFWLAQEKNARDEFLHKGIALEDALDRFSEFVTGDILTSIYGNSAAFDLGILGNAYKTMGMAQPWNFRQERDFRTMKNLPLFANLVLHPSVIPHNAQWDALAEAESLAEMMEVLEKCKH